MHQLKKLVKRFISRESEWSIGIYSGISPLDLTPHPQITNPVLTAKDVTDTNAAFVADPFLLYSDDIWYMFFEVLDLRDNLGKIAFATSQDCLRWTYCQIVIDEPFHLSYPYVFKWDDEYYMIPETQQTSSVRLYKAVEFPTKWKFVKSLVNDRNYVDPTIFHHDGRWWMFTSITGESDTLYLHYSESLTGLWTEHPQSPLIKKDKRIARLAGRATNFGGKTIRYAQDCSKIYGEQVYAFEITRLTTTSYEEVETRKNPVIYPGKVGWNAKGMHTVDPHQVDKDTWIASVDGKSNEAIILKVMGHKFTVYSG